jgi:hypothetical protein
VKAFRKLADPVLIPVSREKQEVAKIGTTPSLTSEFTANPDIGEAEVDN